MLKIQHLSEQEAGINCKGCRNHSEAHTVHAEHATSVCVWYAGTWYLHRLLPFAVVKLLDVSSR